MTQASDLTSVLTGPGLPPRIIYLDTSVLDALQRGNEDVARTLLELRSQSVELRMVPAAYNEATGAYTMAPKVKPIPRVSAATNRIVIEALGVKVDYAGSLQERGAVYASSTVPESKRQIFKAHEADAIIFAQTRVAGGEGAEIFTVDSAMKRNLSSYGLKVASGTEHIVYTGGTQDYRKAFRLLGLPELEPLELLKAGEIQRGQAPATPRAIEGGARSVTEVGRDVRATEARKAGGAADRGLTEPVTRPGSATIRGTAKEQLTTQRLGPPPPKLAVTSVVIGVIGGFLIHLVGQYIREAAANIQPPRAAQLKIWKVYDKQRWKSLDLLASDLPRALIDLRTQRALAFGRLTVFWAGLNRVNPVSRKAQIDDLIDALYDTQRDILGAERNIEAAIIVVDRDMMPSVHAAEELLRNELAPSRLREELLGKLGIFPTDIADIRQNLATFIAKCRITRQALRELHSELRSFFLANEETIRQAEERARP